VKVFFGRGMRRPTLETLLNELNAKTRRDLDALVAVHDQLRGTRFLFQRLTARHGVLMKQARLAWIAEVRDALRLPDTDVR